MNVSDAIPYSFYEIIRVFKNPEYIHIGQPSQSPYPLYGQPPGQPDSFLETRSSGFIHAMIKCPQSGF